MSRMIPQYDTKLFTEIWDEASDFVYDYKHIGIPTTIADQSATTLFYLLYARYGNSPIANYDEEQFKYKIFSVVFQYGPTWEKKLELQQTLRGLQLEDLVDDGSISELFSHEGENGFTESTRGTSERDTEQTVAGTENATTTVEGDTTSTGTSTVTHTGTATVERSGTQDVSHTGTSTVANTGTSTVASTGTSELAHGGTVGTIHDNDVENSGNDTTINNHAFNPGTAPATNAYDPLTYINEQNAQKITKGTKSEQDESSTTTYNNTDTTTNNLQNQTTNNLQNQTTNDLTDTTINSQSDQTTNDLADTTTNDLAGTNDSETVLDRDTTSRTVGSDDVTTTGSKTVTGTDSTDDSRTRTMTVGKLEAYDRLIKLLDSDVTGEFISKFKICFKQFVMPERTWIYVTEEDDE